MSTAVSPASAAAPAADPAMGALAHQLRTQRRHLGATLLVMLLLCSAISLLVAGLRVDRLAMGAAYSFPIGFLCWGLNALGRIVLAAAQDAVDRLQGRALRTQGWGCGWGAAVPSTVFGLLAGPSLGLSLGDAITGGNSPSLLDWGSRSTQVTLGVSVVAAMLATWAISNIERLAAAREAAQAAQRVAAENQLRLLQSQLEPHMLFNTLANLRVLIGLDAAAAQQMLDRLIAFLRATLEASRTPAHPLVTEFERVADYLALMAVRMGPRLQVRLDLPPALAQQPVPPLLLQPLVENAIRHGLEPKVDGGRLEVTARAEGGTLVLEVLDTGVGLAAAAAHGTPGTRFGLAQVRERLGTLHGDRAGLQLEPAGEGGGTRATLRLPLAAVAAEAAVAAPAHPWPHPPAP